MYFINLKNVLYQLYVLYQFKKCTLSLSITRTLSITCTLSVKYTISVKCTLSAISTYQLMDPDIKMDTVSQFDSRVFSVSCREYISRPDPVSCMKYCQPEGASWTGCFVSDQLLI